MMRFLNKRFLATAIVVPLAAAASAPPPADATASACVRRQLVVSPIATDDGHLLFRGQTDPRRSYVAVFEGGRCAGLDRFAAVSVETRTTLGYCAGDIVRVLHPPVLVAGPICTIERLQPTDAATFD